MAVASDHRSAFPHGSKWRAPFSYFHDERDRYDEIAITRPFPMCRSGVARSRRNANAIWYRSGRRNDNIYGDHVDREAGTVGTITIVGIECTVAIASGTKQCTVTKSVPLKRGGVKVATALTSFKLLLTIVTSGGTKSFSEISVKMPLIIIKSTTSGINGCKISSIPKISYSKTSGNGLVWKVITKSLSGVTVTDTSSVGPCGTPVAIANEITSDKLSSAITFNQI